MAPLKDKLYAIRINDWIEVRIAQKRPLTVKSQAVKTVVSQQIDWNRIDPATNSYAYRDVKKDLQIVQVIHEGGEVMGTMSYAKYCSITGTTLRKDGVALIDPTDHKKVEAACR